MGLFEIEHSRRGYWADFALYGVAIVALAVFVVFEGPRAQGLEIALLALAGFVAWGAIEYALHRYVLHGLQPFKAWHAEHHRRPTALIAAPTILSASLIATLVFLPAWASDGLWSACGLTLGVLVGYLSYALTHHATHRWRIDNAWLRRRKRWHAMHHHDARAGCYGVTSALWDHVFGSAGDTPPRATPDAPPRARGAKQ
jgi:sterol desaturase/sphingolipid hydroxylase (fatty acid hydroxylase superfamily)